MIILGGREYGTADQIAAVLTSNARPISAATVRDWGRRAATLGDPLYGLLSRHNVPGQGRGTTLYSLAAAAQVEALTSGSRRVRGKRLDAARGKIAS